MAAEKLFENQIKRFLKSRKAWVLKYWGGGNYTKSGIPDLLICHDGRFIACEVKAERGKPSDLQIKTLIEIGQSGGIPVLLYPKDFDKFKELIDSGNFENYFRKDVKRRYDKILMESNTDF